MVLWFLQMYLLVVMDCILIDFIIVYTLFCIFNSFKNDRG